MTDITTTHEEYFFRAVWNARFERWVCRCKMFNLTIRLSPAVERGIVWDARIKDHNYPVTTAGVNEVIQDLLDQAERYADRIDRSNEWGPGI